jgi:hypothetical protein
MGQFGRCYFHGYVTVCRTSAREKDDIIFIITCDVLEGSLEKNIEMMQYATRRRKGEVG